MKGAGDRFFATTQTERLILPFLACCLIHSVLTQGQAVDVALQKPIRAELTCGAFGEETYFEHSQIFLQPSVRVLNACFNTSTHPASAMVDGNSATWWQSTERSQLINSGYGLNGRPEAVITLDLQQYFETEKIIIQMADSKRPEHMTLLKSVDGIVYTPWIYRVTNEQQCASLYNVPVLATPRDLDSQICQTYKSGSLAPRFEKIEFDLSAIDDKLAAWRNLRYLKIQFYQMDLTLGINGGKFQHYTVSELNVLAECVCNGQDISCDVNNSTGQYQCVCGGQTTGNTCHMCQPFYNQQEFFYGKSCQPCNCFEHSSSCFYDATIANLSLSLDANGERNGGGVCINCQHNAAGVNCEKCQSLYYRPSGVNQRSVNACVPCDCHGPGVRTNLETGLAGDCIMNDDVILPPGMVPGDCYCKSNVTGKKCDRCIFGSYDLSASNPEGCTDCGCDIRGTVGGTPMCNITNGQCPCKSLVMGQHCDQCVNEYYGLTTIDVNGCKRCLCNIGASQSNICNKDTGQCPCRRNIGQRRCTEPLPDYYYPDPHFLHGEFEDIRGSWDRSLPGFSGFGYATLSETVPGITYITIRGGLQLAGRYYLLLRYESTVNVTASLFVFASGVSTIRTTTVFPACPGSWCFLRLGDSTDRTLVLLQGKIYTLRISVSDKLKMDKAVLLPWEFTNGTVPLGSSTAAQFQQRCDVFNNDMKLGTLDESFCLTNLFSLTTYYLNGALPCDCDQLGSEVNSTCDSYGGQCQCKMGVGGRKCDDCLLEYFNLGENGCQSCDCNSDFKVCDSQTGFCVCPPNVIGRQCDLCAPNYWNWTSLHGCEPCECDPVGSLSMQCNLTTGMCACKPGVRRDKCRQCEDNFKGFSRQGCVACGCDPDGTTSATCEQVTGQCPCKTNTAGLLCDRCRRGAFNNDVNHPDGCLACICMGITDRCDSSTWRYTQVSVPVASNGGRNKTTNFDIVTESDTMIMDLKIVEENGILMAEAMIGSQPRQYWAPIDGLHGNLLPLYEKLISFTVRYDSDDTTGLPLVNNRLIIVGSRNGSRYDLKVPTVMYDTTTQINVTVSDNNLVDTQVNVTRAEFLTALQDVVMVLIPASYYDRMHTSRIGNIKYDSAAPDGTGSRALALEQCQCPTGYEGLSCERCVTGYRRTDVATQGYLGLCEPCTCNGHATTCDPDTGACIDCQHNTAGDNCELCKAEYYGNALLGTPFDCLACPCYLPRVANSTCTNRAGQIHCLYCAEGYKGILCDSCDQFYFGNPEIPQVGRCEKCSCNNNSVDCNDRTGACLNCQFNTTGVNCQFCVEGAYGNASNQDCRNCGCDRKGSQSLICNHSSGQCDCFGGIGGRTCDTCLPDYYGYTDTSFTGCLACECNPFGSSSTQCLETGECVCLTNAQGTKCDACGLGFWGLPHSACAANDPNCRSSRVSVVDCQPCACDPIGSVDPREPCESVSGQCRCKPGVGGRQCDRCLFLHINFGPAGCTACSECQFSIGNDTRALQSTWREYWREALMIREVQEQDSILQELADSINTTSADLGLSEGRLDVLTAGIRDLNMREPALNRTVEDLLDRVNRLEDRATRVDNSSAEELARQEAMQQDAEEASSRAVALNSTAPSILSMIQNYKSTADQLLKDSGQSSSGLDVNFDAEKLLVSSVLSNVTTTAFRANTRNTEAELLSNQTMTLNNLTRDAENQLNQIDAEIKGTDEFISIVKGKADVVWNNFNTSKYYMLHAEALFMEAQSLLSLAEAVLGQSLTNYDLAVQMLTDTEGILRGVTSGRLPVDPSILGNDQLQGIWSWEQSAKQLESEINATLNRVLSRQPLVEEIENRARNLTVHSQALVQEFSRVRPFGESAVDAIQNYETVAQTLDKSVTMALQANRTVDLVMDMLRGVSVISLEREANASLTQSKAILVDVLKQQVAIDVLARQLQTANASLSRAVSLWNDTYTQANLFLRDAATIHQLAQEPRVAEPIEAAYVAADIAIEVSDDIRLQDSAIQPQIDRQAALAAVIQNDNQNATSLATRLDRQVSSLQNTLNNDVQPTLNQINALRNDTARQMSSLEATMAAIEAKIEHARQKLLGLEQPVRLTSEQYETVTNPAANEPPMVHTELVLTFQVTTYGTGVLLFMENNQTNEFFLLHFIERQLVFDFNNGDGALQIKSLASICSGCWFKVIATRYGIDGHLTVIKLETGGIATAHTRGSTPDDRLALNTPVYIGGLPPTYQTVKAEVTGRNFAGCIAETYLNGKKLPLWETLLTRTSEAQCCPQPPADPGPATMNAFATSGFGYVSISCQNFSVASQSHVQFRFRTFDQSGVMLLVDQKASGSYYGLFMTNGRVLFAYGSAIWMSSLQSLRSYSDGEWYQLTAMHNRTYTMLVLEYVDKTISTQVEVRSNIMVLPMDLADLQQATLTFGGQNPKTERHGPVTDYFAACICNVMFARPDEVILRPVDVLGLAVARSGVSATQCFERAIPGLGFSELDAYARLYNVRMSISVVEFTLQTYEPSGIIMYGERQERRTPNFYIAVFNGDVFVQFNQGRGVQSALRTRGLYLSDGREHAVHVDFSYQNNPRLSVNGAVHHGAVQMTPNIAIAGGPIYVGGAPPWVALDSQLPTQHSLIGGIRLLKINEQAIDLYSPTTLDVRVQKAAWLSGLPLPLSEPPPLPYSTTPAPPTTAHPTCASPTQHTFSDTGIRFGHASESYVGFDLMSYRQLFLQSFAITVGFRAVKPNGILVYAADTNTAVPNHYFSLFMREGHLVFSMDTDSTISNVNSPKTNGKYDDGRWWEVVVLRINDFAAILVTNNSDYMNNGVHPTTSANLVIDTLLYVGGIPRSLQGSPFVGIRDNLIGNFHGCIRKVEVDTQELQNVMFDLGSPDAEAGTLQCFSSIQPGVFLNGTTSSVRVGDATGPDIHNVSPPFTFNITFQGTVRDGTLLVAYRSMANFFLVEIFDGVVRGVLSDSRNQANPFVFTSTRPGSYMLCDNNPHTVRITLTIRLAELMVDDAGPEYFDYPPNFVFTPINAIPIYIGGLGDQRRAFPVAVSRKSFQGCIIEFYLQQRRYSLTEMDERVGVFSGCPR